MSTFPTLPSDGTCAPDWFLLEQQLDQDGCAIIRSLLSHEACDNVSALYPRLSPIANHWYGHMNLPIRFPDSRTLHHGVSRLHSGKRHILEIIFHDAP
jgi:hypothetical protein